MKEEQKKQKVKVITKNVSYAAAAIIIITFTTYFYQSRQNDIHIEKVSQNSVDLGVNFGSSTSDKKKDKIQVTTYKKQSDIPKFIREIPFSTIAGVDVAIGRDGEKHFFAYYQLDDSFYYVEGKDVSEKVFVDYLEKQLKK